jgi:MoxR-like ATPase
MEFPFYAIKPQPTPDVTADIPPLQPGIQTNPAVYQPDEGLQGAVNVALMLGQPLLLTGEPGTGKTQLAYHLAWQLGLEVLKFETKSTSTAKDLFYTYDALGRFHAAQAAQLGEHTEKTRSVDYISYNALGQAILLTNPLEVVKDRLPQDFLLTEPRRSVVLIDEIDKAPRDFPNDILNEIENLYFRIPELSNAVVKANPDLAPILVLTSNSEKHLPDAFLRRCVYYNIPFPDKERLEQIIDAHLESVFSHSQGFLQEAMAFFWLLRDQASGLRKSPSTAELLNWLTALHGLFKKSDRPITEQPENVKLTLSSLVKTAEDQDTARQLFDEFVSNSALQEEDK